MELARGTPGGTMGPAIVGTVCGGRALLDGMEASAHVHMNFSSLVETRLL
jgi:hypothetical protein